MLFSGRSISTTSWLLKCAERGLPLEVIPSFILWLLGVGIKLGSFVARIKMSSVLLSPLSLGLLGGSMDRIFRNILATLILLQQQRPPPKLVQIILGRWVFILQFRRPAMSILSRSWDYITLSILRPPPSI